MVSAEHTYLRDLLFQDSGYALPADKDYLLESKLLPLARRHGMASLAALVDAMRFKTNRDLVREVTDAMTINETFFFRDGRPFDIMRETVLPRLIDARRSAKKLRLWSAAASTGQEAYSLAMLLRDRPELGPEWDLSITATDISDASLTKAKTGIYSNFEVGRGLPPTYRDRYFRPQGSEWEIAPELRSLVEFRWFNLMDRPDAMGPFDIIFCRNVLIYFDPATKQRVLGNLLRTMAPDGVLVLGGAETVIGLSDNFTKIGDGHGVYVRTAPATDGQLANPSAAMAMA